MAEREKSSDDDLRRRAEELLESRPEQLDKLDPKQIRELLLELQVHRIELELQNDELRRSQSELEKAHLRFARLYNKAPVGYVVLDRAGIIKQTNATFASMVHADGGTLPGTPFADRIANEDEPIFRARFKSFFRNPADKFMEVRFGESAKTAFHGRLEAAPHNRQEGDTAAGHDELLVTVSDITERRRAEERVEHLNRVLLAIRNVNQLIVKEKDRASLIGQVCENLVETRGYRNAWIVLLDDTGAPAESASSDSADEASSLVESLRRGQTLRCVDEAQKKAGAVLTRDPSRDCPGCPLAYRYGERAAMTTALRYGEKTYGLLTVSIPTHLAHDHDERALFEEVGGDIAFALHDMEVEEQRERAERALRDNEALLRESQKIAHVGSWELDVHTRTLTWSDEVYRIFGRRPREFEPTYEAFLAMVHPDDRAAVDAAYGESLREERDTYEIEHRIVRHDGEQIRTVHEKCEHIRDEAGRVVRSVGMVQDITPRVVAEQSLARSEHQKNLILNSTAEMVAYYDRDLRIIWANRASAESVGMSAEELRGRHCYEIWHQRTQTCSPCPLLQALEVKEPREGYQKTPDGRYWHLRGYPVLDDTGEVTALVEFGLDITDKHEAEQTIAAERERLAVTLRSIGDGVITTDTAGNVVIINTIAEQLTGWSQEEAAGKPLGDIFCIVNEFTRKPCINPVDKVLSTGAIIELSNHTMLVSRDGTERIIADSGAPIRDNHGTVIGVVLVFRDVTEKQRLLERMQQTDKLDSLGVLAGGIAHDFNNLLGGIFGYLDMARECSTADKTVSGYLDKALTAYNRAKDLTQQLLTFSKGGAPVRKPGDLAALVKESASFVLAGSTVACRYDIPDDIPPCDYDENQIGQVIDNIVMNAQQAMPGGGTIDVSLRKVSVADGTIGTLREGDYIRLSITDRGVGIPPEIQGRIFDPFFTTKQKGSGLGLATCYSIVQKHDGDILVESTPGKGSTFHVYLPTSTIAIADYTSQPDFSFRGSGSVIVMDDEDFIREIAGAMLKAAGYEVIEARDGEEALRACAVAIEEGREVAAALFDLTIPGGMGGKEAVLEMRTRYPSIPVFASSGYSEDPVMARPHEFGFTDSIRKPYRRRELHKMLADNLDHEG